MNENTTDETADRIEQQVSEGIKNVWPICNEEFSVELSDGLVTVYFDDDVLERRVLKLAHYGRITHVEAAEKLGWSQSKVAQEIRERFREGETDA